MMAGRGRTTIKSVEFFNIEVSQLTDGGFRVSITATTIDEEEPQLLCQELVTERVSSVPEALSLIERTIST
jgi:hypothetical protein